MNGDAKSDFEYSSIMKQNIIEEELPLTGPNDCFLFHCALCMQNFNTNDEQLVHDEEKHFNKDGNFQCFECEFSSAEKRSVWQHYSEHHQLTHNSDMVSSHQLKLLCCQMCDQAFFGRSFLRKHIQQAHGLEIVITKCLLCPRKCFSQKYAFEHMEKYHVGYKILCSVPYCKWRSSGKMLSEPYSTNVELEEHTKEKHISADKYTCHICGTVFSKGQRAMFNRHTESHSMGEPTFNCQHCSKCFFFETDRIAHTKKFHTTKYCDSCEYKTPSLQVLKSHVRSHHTMERPFKCSTCGKGFVTHQHMRRHKEIHEPVKKYECSVCGKKFSGKRHLVTHNKIHSKTYEAECHICDRKFVQKCNMKLHMKKHHPEVAYDNKDLRKKSNPKRLLVFSESVSVSS